MRSEIAPDTESDTEDAQQGAVRRFMEDPGTHGGQSVAVIETHASVIFLVGDDAYKMKRAVRYPYLDYASLAARRRFCHKERAINVRSAPTLYRGCLPITQQADGGLAIDGPGAPVEWLVWMRRFDQNQLLDHIAQADDSENGLDRTLADAIADAVYRFHNDGPPLPVSNAPAELARVSTGILAELRRHSPQMFAPEPIDRLEKIWAEALEAHEAIIRGRVAAGAYRECHGDLHLGNVVVLDGAPTLFDAIEFDPRMTHIDRLYDLAFLIMDLLHRDRQATANRILNRYLGRQADYAGLAILPLFLSLRAAIRAHTGASAADRIAAGKMAAKTEAGRYLDLALRVLQPDPETRPAQLIAIGGPSGSGKSTVAARVAPRVGSPPGAIVLRSDVIRKRLFGMEPEEALGADAYNRTTSDRVFAAMAVDAEQVLEAGYTVICDAVFGQEPNVSPLERLADKTRRPLLGYWLDAPPEVLMQRVQDRGRDASDANAAVVQQQQHQLRASPGWRRMDNAQDQIDVSGLIVSDVAARVADQSPPAP